MTYKNNYIYKEVNNLISKYKTRDPFEIANRLNIKIKYMDNVKNLLGMYAIVERNRFIFLNSNLSYNMKKMVLAHEIGHDLLHKEVAKSNIIQEYKIFDVSSMTEYEANIFAAHLLIDDDELINLIKEGKTDMEISSLLNVNINLLLFKVNEINKNNNIYNIRNFPKSNFFKDL